MQKRKPTRLKDYDYSQNGAYFITICVKDRKQLLSTIVGDDALIVPNTNSPHHYTIRADAHIRPQNKLSEIGLLCDKYINNINIKYDDITVDKYVIMPNHIHLIISIHGTMRASSPTRGVVDVIRSLKTMVTREIGYPIWQRSYHDHIIRGENDYQKIWEYIDTNVVKWKDDCFYSE